MFVILNDFFVILEKQIANSNNRAFLNSSSLMLDITDNKFDIASEKLRTAKGK